MTCRDVRIVSSLIIAHFQTFLSLEKRLRKPIERLLRKRKRNWRSSSHKQQKQQQRKQKEVRLPLNQPPQTPTAHLFQKQHQKPLPLPDRNKMASKRSLLRSSKNNTRKRRHQNRKYAMCRAGKRRTVRSLSWNRNRIWTTQRSIRTTASLLRTSSARSCRLRRSGGKTRRKRRAKRPRARPVSTVAKASTRVEGGPRLDHFRRFSENVRNL